MKVQAFGASQERRILVAMIGDEAVCGRVAALWTDEGLFAHPASNVVGRLCVENFNRYGRAAGRDIEHLVRSWADGAKSEDLVGEVDDLIQSIDLNKLGEKINVDLLTDEAGEYFDRVQMEKRADLIKSHIAAGKVKKAREVFDNYRPVQMGAHSFVNPLTDDEALRQVHAEKREPLIEYQGGLQDFFGYALEREALVAILAAEKMGKSYFLLEFAFAAVEQGRKVAMFECGDLTQRQVMGRLLTRVCGRPLFLPRHRDRLEYQVPVALTMQDHQVKVKHEIYEIRKSLPLEKIKKYRDDWTEKYNAHDNWRLSVHSTSSLSVPGIRSILSRWEKEGFNPDVVVCLATGSQVLTDRGLVPIESVKGSDRLWDGVNWVKHGGVVYKGEREVITYEGLTATPEHLVYSEEGWRTLESCKRLRLRIAKTGSGEQEVRLSKGHLSGGEGEERQEPFRQGHSSQVCSCGMHQMQEQQMVSALQPAEWNCSRLPYLSTTQKVSEMALLSGHGTTATMRESQPRIMEVLRGEGHQVQVCLCCGGLRLGYRQPLAVAARHGFGQKGQRRTLRGWESSMVYEEAELLAYYQKPFYDQTTQISTSLSRSQVQRRVRIPFSFQNTQPRGVGQAVEEGGQTRKCGVWDILDAGPLHRFTVQGFLVHNCDYADILAGPMPGGTESREQINATWKALSKMRQDLRCLVITATQANADAYEADLLNRRNFSEDKRKHAHVTAMFALNRSDAEKRMGVYRLNWLDRRDEAYSEREVCYVAGCLETAQPMILSHFMPRWRMK